MYYKKYESERIYLSVIDPNDYKTFTRWINDESLARGLGNFKFNFTEQDEKEYLENSNKNGTLTFAIIRKEDNKLLGSYGLEIKDNVSRRIHVGGFIGDKEDRGKGYGTEAIRLILEYGFKYLNLQNIKLDLMEFNGRALKCYQKCGFKEYGRRRKCKYINGKYYDTISMDILAEEFEGDYIRNKNI